MALTGDQRGRVEQRRIAERHARAARSRNAIWRAWWAYPLVAAITACVYLGIQSASAPVVEGPSVVTTIDTVP
jgi:hypothetical protein